MSRPNAPFHVVPSRAQVARPVRGGMRRPQVPAQPHPPARAVGRNAPSAARAARGAPAGTSTGGWPTDPGGHQDPNEFDLPMLVTLAPVRRVSVGVGSLRPVARAPQVVLGADRQADSSSTISSPIPVSAGSSNQLWSSPGSRPRSWLTASERSEEELSPPLADRLGLAALREGVELVEGWPLPDEVERRVLVHGEGQPAAARLPSPAVGRCVIDQEAPRKVASSRSVVAGDPMPSTPSMPVCACSSPAGSDRRRGSRRG